MIDKLHLKNFTIFKKLDIDFSPKINIIIGENGTGKTQALKAAYSLCSANNRLNGKADVSEEDIQKAITEKIINVFKPLDDKLGKMRKRGVSGADESTEFTADFTLGKKVSGTFHSNSSSVKISENENYERYSYAPVYIPTKEVLSFMKGFNSLYEKFELSFDQTYQDICLLLDLPEIRSDKLHEKSKWIMDEIEDVCGGKFIFHGGGRVTFKAGDDEFSANMIAEGFRKMGILSRLLETGSIQPGISGPLFWDEPESNMNPKLMKLLVKMLLELARNNQQIILATHDYVLLKWFDLLPKTKEDHIRYHILYRDKETDQVLYNHTDNFDEIHPNIIDEVFGSLINQEIENDMGTLGK